jgi:hypothetical protein
MIEKAHVTVRAKSAKVTACTIRTVDGSDRVGRNGSNVSDVDWVITVVWDGRIQKVGYTELELVYDNQNRVTKNFKILKTNARVNVYEIDWPKLAFKIGGFIVTHNL